MTKTRTLTGESGQEYKFDVYTFDVYPIDTDFEPLGAIYCISKRVEKSDGTGRHTTIYIGQTGDLSERFDNHHKEDCFKLHNANCISIHFKSKKSNRLEIETDLIGAYNPPCND